MAVSALTKTMMVLEEFRKLHPEMPIQIAVVLLHIARKPGINLRELGDLTGLSKSSVSRHVAALSGLDPKSTIQSQLVKFYEDPADRRNKVAELTPAGQRFIRSIEHLIEETN